MNYDDLAVSRKIVRFCSIECRLQMSGELSVGWMVDGWLYAQAHCDNLPVVDDVLALGRLIEPNVNHGFRTVNVRVGWDVKMDWDRVPSAMVNLMEALHLPPQPTLYEGVSTPIFTPDTFFKEYEEVHPFQDGNGRTGAILFNWLNGTLDDPVWPPNFWNDPRRTVGYGA